VATITFLNKKGGVGKTSMATNLAGAIALNNPSTRVLLIDGDTETNSAMGWAARRSQERPPLPFDVVSQRAAHIAAGKGNYRKLEGTGTGKTPSFRSGM
jgi:cellulose biosynthesis protein BcsQ